MSIFSVLLAAIVVPFATCKDYIVVFNSSLDAPSHSSHKQFLASTLGVTVKHEYSFGTFVGYAATLDEDAARQLQTRPEVALVERDIPLRQNAGTCSTQQKAPSWGMQRVSETKYPLDGTYTYKEGLGSDVDIYLIDAGVRVTHEDFEGRASFGANVVGGTQTTDPDGHGTHCAGVAVSKTYGMCKSCSVISVIIFDDEHKTAASSLIAGFDWVLKNVKSGRKSVVSISVGGDSGETSEAMDAAANALVAAGVHVVGSAGNYGGDACQNSPARASSLITVSSTSNEFANEDFFSPAANYGKCVNILAPGDDIVSLGHTSDTEVGVVMSGTSMATPHVAGVIAMLTSSNPSKTLLEVENLMYTNTLPDLVQLLPADTPNKLLHSPCADVSGFVV